MHEESCINKHKALKWKNCKCSKNNLKERFQKNIGESYRAEKKHSINTIHSIYIKGTSIIKTTRNNLGVQVCSCPSS